MIVQNFFEGPVFFGLFFGFLAIQDSTRDLVFPDQGWNLRPLQWKRRLKPLD